MSPVRSLFCTERQHHKIGPSLYLEPVDSQDEELGYSIDSLEKFVNTCCIPPDRIVFEYKPMRLPDSQGLVQECLH